MKKVMKLAYLLMGVALLLSSCSEDIFPGGSESNEDVTISLAYSDVSPRDIVVNSRATDAEERHLDNLYIYIFDGNGNLKGYKGIEGEANLTQNTNSTNKAQITDIKTRSGESYIYAVANISTGLYPVETSSGTVEENKLPINLDEEKARAGEYAFTLDQLKALTFKRSDTSIDITSAFLMSGAVQEGKLVNITTAGAIAGDDNAIRLSRIVSKVKFTIKAANTTGVTRSFKLETYDIMNIAVNGSLVGKIDGNSRKKTTNVNNDIGNTVRPNDVENDAQFFEVYLPENLQDAVNNVTTQAEREDDSQSIPKVFTNAPAYGTYVMLKGKYEETTSSSTKSADVTYYVHLGDCSRDKNNYDVERNCKYTYNITVAGVDKIIVEATKEEGKELQPGAEGVVLEYGATGKNMTLDSHYEYMVMRFYQKDIQELKNAGKGYFYQVYALGNHTDVINVGATTDGKDNGVDTSWIQFAIKCSRDRSSSTYSADKTDRGTACSYPGTQSSDLYTVDKFLKYLYDNANSTSIWTGGYDYNKRSYYVDATCFISENYYKNLTWNKYVNDVDKRAFYVANEVETSNDGRSVYAKTQYGLTQYNIQTFYDRSKAGSITAYGCETINDEEGKGFSVNGSGSRYNSYGSDTWNGRANMVKDIKSSDNWESLKNNTSLIKACMSRNRDLNGDGKISDNEIRWYAPTISQYIGIWIGEEIMSTEAKLFNRATSTLEGESDRMLYYSSTNNQNTYFSEEGMATNHYSNGNTAYPPKLVRCLRNLKSNNEGYDSEPVKYYTYNATNSKVTLDKVDEKALNTTGELGELNEHEERSAVNKPAKSFKIAANTYPTENSSRASMENVVYGNFKCYGNYSEGDTKWRVPNQREMSVMYLIDPNLINMTYCRTKFSNLNFRKSWTYTSVFTMATNWSDKAYGKVRCIKVLK